MTAGSSALAAGEPDAGYARLQLFVSAASCLLNQVALLFADLGDKDQAFRWLNTAYQERDTWLEGLKTDFQLDALRSDPRFSELVRKVGLPQ